MDEMLPESSLGFSGKGTLRPEHLCAIIVAICLLTAVVCPTPLVSTAAIAFAAFWVMLSRYRSPVLTNLAFLFIFITLILVLTSTDSWGAFLAWAGLGMGNLHFIDLDTRDWAVRYVAIAIDAFALGACLIQVSPTAIRQPRIPLFKSIESPSIYLCAAIVPLLLQLVVYFWMLRGTGYEGVLEAAQGPVRKIFLLVLLTHAAFIRLLCGWPSLGRKARMVFVASVCLFFYIYVFLLTARTNLFVFTMYFYYFRGWRIRWYVKVSALAAGLLLFSWIATHRSVNAEDFAASNDSATSEAVAGMSVGPEFMLDMVRWSNERIRKDGPKLGAVSMKTFFITEGNPADLYAEDKAPVYFESGGGFGFFYVAELVLDFGYVGGLVGAFLLGMIFQKVSVAQSAIVQTTVLPALLGASFPLIRNVFLMTLKSPLYIVIFCILLDRFVFYSKHFAEHIRLTQPMATIRL